MVASVDGFCGEGSDQSRVGRRSGVAVQRIRLNPFDFLAVQRSGFPGDDDRLPEQKEDLETGFTMDGEGDGRADRGLDAEFFPEFPDQRVLRALIRGDLATWELPQAGHVATLRSSGQEDPGGLVPNDAGDDGEAAGVWHGWHPTAPGPRAQSSSPGRGSLRAMSDAFDRLVEIMDRLRDPGGCPWDAEQTLDSLSGYLIEESYEVVDAVRSGDGAALCEELGDLLLQVVFMAKIGREKGWFTLDDVANGIADKMVRRHPHVFADRDVDGADEVVRNWEEIKREEKAGDEKPRSLLDGVPNALPALLKAYRMTQKAAAVGFDWQRPGDVMAKIHEEVHELEVEVEGMNGDPSPEARAEMGDVLFVMANLARHLGVEPETALQSSNEKFQRRFAHIEAAARADGRQVKDLTLEEMDRLWQEAKASE
jgi:tetrapyrrole methylase family protein/MazG family protein